MQLQRLKKPLLTASLLAGGLILGFTVLPLILPFVLGYLLALAAERGVRFLGERTGLPRWVRSGLCLTGLFAGAGLVICFFVRMLWEELLRLVGMLPELLDRLRPTLEELRLWLESQALRAPGNLGRALARWLEELFAGGAGLLDSLYGFLSGLVSAVVTGLPRLLLALVTTVIAAYMTSAALPEVEQWLRRHLPPAWHKGLCSLREKGKTAFGGWLKAQMKMLLIVYGVLTVGLWILGVEFALLFGGLIALLDALPVLGTGTVLIPWALLCFLQADSARGLGLLILYAVSALVRTVLEPRLVGRQLGMPPLATLMAFYVGYRLFGISGMLLLPPAVMIVKPFLAPPKAA